MVGRLPSQAGTRQDANKGSELFYYSILFCSVPFHPILSYFLFLVYSYSYSHSIPIHIPILFLIPYPYPYPSIPIPIPIFISILFLPFLFPAGCSEQLQGSDTEARDTPWLTDVPGLFRNCGLPNICKSQCSSWGSSRSPAAAGSSPRHQCAPEWGGSACPRRAALTTLRPCLQAAERNDSAEGFSHYPSQLL